MHSFLATCKDRYGRGVVERVEALDLRHARELLEERGFVEIVFETDDELYPSSSGCADPLPPELDLQIRRSGVIPWSVWLRVWGKNLAPFLVLNAWSWWDGAPWSVLDRVGFALTACVGAAAVLLGVPLHLYHRLLAASAWHRWDRVLRLAPWMAVIGRLTRNELLRIDANVRLARALIGKGRVAEAFERVRGLEQAGRARARLAELHWAVGRRDDAVALSRQTAEALPHKADGWIDYALILFRAGDFSGARQALDRGRACELTAMARCFVDFVEGVLARETGEPARAVEVLEGAIEQNRALATNPLAEACRLCWTSHLVLALAAAGRRDEAREKLESCRLWLRAAEEDDLLARCERAVAYVHPIGPG